MSSEPEKAQERYARRVKVVMDERYNFLNPSVWHGVQERQRVLIGLLKRHSHAPLSELKVIEIGCGSGGNLLEMLRMGFSPANLVGNELLEDRAQESRKKLPVDVKVLAGDALTLDFGSEQFDIVYQSTVFTSILDDAFQNKLAEKMWDLVKPGGFILWYDFIYNNPNNPDVKGVPLKRIKQLFPKGEFSYRKVTLAPPISRIVCKFHPSFYSLFNTLPLLRTHVLCSIKKQGN